MTEERLELIKAQDARTWARIDEDYRNPLEIDRHDLLAYVDTLQERIAELERKRDYWMDKAKTESGLTFLDAKAKTATAILREVIAECDIDDNGHTCVPTDEIDRVCRAHGAEEASDD